MSGPALPTAHALAFGPFELRPAERLLTRDGMPVPLGGRTLDILIALVSRPNEVVSKRALMADVWPDVQVEEGSLRFHIAGLRKVLEHGKDGARYIATVAGRGYCFVAPVLRTAKAGSVTAPVFTGSTFLPVSPARMVGREDSTRAIAAELAVSRFVTIVGPGGVGKTTVAVAVAHTLLPMFDGALLFVDFSLLSDPRMVPVSVASMLGLSVQSDDPLPSLVALLRGRRMLVVLDNCEHVIDDAARLAVQLLLAAPDLQILATSREPLRAQGERVHRLAPLDTPPEDAALSAKAMLDFPAVQLFVDRALASGAQLDLLDAGAAIVARICRKLDGVALAIELAAGRVGAYGLQQTAALLDERFTLLWPGQRTAPPRQKTLRATLDWSYGLLTSAERVVFRRLAVFVGVFDLEAALAVVTDDALNAGLLFSAIDSLVAKSMVTAIPDGAMMHYRLLDTARAYALDIAMDDAERIALAGRHVEYCLRWLEQYAADGRPLFDASRRGAHLRELHNIRAGLEWCFGDEGSKGTGVRLATAATPVFFAMSLLTECQQWAQRAILELDVTVHGGRQEMRLQAALALSSMWTSGNSIETFTALERSITIAEQLGDPLNQMLLLAPRHVFHMRTGKFGKALQDAKHVAELAQTACDPVATGLARILLGYSYHFAGNLADAQHELQEALDATAVDLGRVGTWASHTMLDDAMAAPILALAASAAPSALARTLWLRGHTALALSYVEKTIADAAGTNHPVTRLIALMYAISVLIWNGDFNDAGEQAARFVATAETYDLTSYVQLGRCFQGQVAIGRGDTEAGIALLLPALNLLRRKRYELFTTSFHLSLADAYRATGRLKDSLSLLDATIQGVEDNGDFCYMPELLRTKASIIVCDDIHNRPLAIKYLREAIKISRLQKSHMWEIRSSNDLEQIN